jgi:hypothetical protein
MLIAIMVVTNEMDLHARTNGGLNGYFKHIFDYMNGIGSNKYY